MIPGMPDPLSPLDHSNAENETSAGSTLRLRRRSCAGKQRHTSLRAGFAARRAIMRASKAESGSLNVYRCAFCGGFHVGHRKGSGLRAS